MKIAKITPDDLLASLAETIRWISCQPFTHWKASAFRTPELISKYPYGEPPSMRKYDYDLMCGIVSECVSRRKQRLRDLGINVDTRCNDLRGGRLLKHNMGETTNTDVPRQETGDFFDSWDLPPWDCWVALVVDETNAHFGYLISWISPELCETVNKSVQSSFEENNIWFGDSLADLGRLLPGLGAS